MGDYALYAMPIQLYCFRLHAPHYYKCNQSNQCSYYRTRTQFTILQILGQQAGCLFCSLLIYLLLWSDVQADSRSSLSKLPHVNYNQVEKLRQESPLYVLSFLYYSKRNEASVTIRRRTDNNRADKLLRAIAHPDIECLIKQLSIGTTD